MSLTRVTYSMIQDGFVNVRDFGAVGDGVTDDSAAIMAAITAAVGSTLLLPSGSYLVTGDTLSLSGSTNIIGQPGAVLKLASSLASKKLLLIEPTGDKVSISGVTFDVNQPTADSWTNISVEIDGATNILLENCSFTNSASSAFPAANNGYGVYLKGAYSSISIENCVFALHRYAVVTEPSSSGSDITVQNCSFSDLAGDGVEINVPSGSCNNINVCNSTFRNLGSNNVGRGFGVGASGAVGSTISDLFVTGCSFYGVDNQGVHIEDGCKNVTVANNYFESCGTAAAISFGSSIYVAASVALNRAISNVIVQSNTLVLGVGSDYGIFAAGNYLLTGFSVANNFVDGAGNGIGIVVNSVNSKAGVHENTVKNCNGVAIRYDSTSGAITDNFCFDDQTVKTQTYGLQLQSNARQTVVRDNNFTGNINIGIDVSGVTFPKQINSVQTYQTELSASGAAYSNWFDIADLGVAASGTVYLNFLESTNRSTSLLTISWDGSTLTGSSLNVNSSGTLAISGTFASALQVSGGVLQGRVYNSGGPISSTMTMEASLNGAIMLN